VSISPEVTFDCRSHSSWRASVVYDEIIKTFSEAPQPERYDSPPLIDTERRVTFGQIDHRLICTPYIEQNHFTIRTFVRRLIRLALGFSKKLANWGYVSHCMRSTSAFADFSDL
jgi:hypothetical protein